jgi:methyl-accepting chemotaxis protein
MNQHWTFGQKVGAGFAVVVALAILIGVIAVRTLDSVVAAKDRIINVNSHLLLDAERLSGASDEHAAAFRGYLLTTEERYTEQIQETTQRIRATIDRLRRGVSTDESRQMLEAIERAEADYQVVIERVLAARRGGAAIEVVARQFNDQVAPLRRRVSNAIEALVIREERLLGAAQQAGSEVAHTAINQVVAVAAVAIGISVVIAVLLSRALGRQIGSAVGHVQSSAAELQASANQQASGAKEQATAMSEITTTISELLATSRQIAESAQRVAQIGQQTQASARSGEGQVDQARELMGSTRRQVDLIVSHMLDLGKKSQQIGAVLDIVSELAEQTNILAINATIEAAGAGESGRRFSVVADEIRDLADRVAGSTKEIRALIDDVRGAVNTTVMATETGAKAVDAGIRQFGDVAQAFQQIAGLVASTTEASREIELSTKQQTSAVEQVNIATADVAQATRENEVSAKQTLDTVSQLAHLSTDLLRLVRPQETATAAG